MAHDKGNKLNLGIIYGGVSGEHDVSIMSRNSIVSNINRDKYNIANLYIDKSGHWHLEDADGQRKSMEKGRLDELLDSLDIAFPVLHGPYGEDGTLQGFLEIRDVAYVGSGVLGSALAMDKHIAKLLFIQAGLPVCRFQVVSRTEWEATPDTAREKCREELAFPWFVKPVNMGSSVGITRVVHEDSFEAAVADALRYDHKVIIEEGVDDTREIEISVLGNDHPELSTLGEIRVRRSFYDYQAKYFDDTTELIIPAELPSEVITEIRETARKAYLALGCSGLSRIDFFVSRADHRVYINEINTMPGFTTQSMYPRLWVASGLEYNALIDRLIQLGLERYGQRVAIRPRLD